MRHSSLIVSSYASLLLGFGAWYVRTGQRDKGEELLAKYLGVPSGK